MTDVVSLASRLPSPAPGGEGVAVFDADGTLWDGDIQEALLQRLISARQLLHVNYAVNVYEVEYHSLLRRDPAAAMARGVTLLAGLELSVVQEHVRALLTAEFRAARYSEMRRFVDALRERGYTPWICSASAEEVVKVAAPDVGFAPENAIGVRVEMRGGSFSDEIVPPVTYGPGKVAAIDARIGRRPHVAGGNGSSDLEMLASAELLAVAVNPAPKLRQAAQGWGWAVVELNQER